MERPKLQKVSEDCLSSVIFDFMKSPKWTLVQGGYSEETRRNWARELNFMAHPDVLGAVKTTELAPFVMQAFFEGIADKPGKQQQCWAAFRQFLKWAIVKNRLPLNDYLFGVEIGKGTGGHIPWDEDHVALATRVLREHCEPLARAVTLTANIGQRGSDIVRMKPSRFEVYKGQVGIQVRQKKTGRVLWCPLPDELVDEIATWGVEPGDDRPFVRSPDGSDWARQSMTELFGYYRDKLPELAPLRLPPKDRRPGDNLTYLQLDEGVDPGKDRGLVLHGLRGTACVRLSRLGATNELIATTVGMSLKMVERYTRFSHQKENALAAVALINARRANVAENVVSLSRKAG